MMGENKPRERKCPYCASENIVVHHRRLAGFSSVFVCKDCGKIDDWTEDRK
jgi:transposase-like protein